MAFPQLRAAVTISPSSDARRRQAAMPAPRYQSIKSAITGTTATGSRPSGVSPTVSPQHKTLSRSRSQTLAPLSPHSLSPLAKQYSPKPVVEPDDPVYILDRVLHEPAQFAWDGGLAALYSVCKYTNSGAFQKLQSSLDDASKLSMAWLHHAATSHAIWTIDLFVMARELLGQRVVYCSKYLGVDPTLTSQWSMSRGATASTNRLRTPHLPLRSPVAGSDHLLHKFRHNQITQPLHTFDDIALDSLIQDARRAQRLFDFLLGPGGAPDDSVQLSRRHTISLPARGRHSMPSLSASNQSDTMCGALVGRKFPDGAGARRVSAMLQRRCSIDELRAAVESHHPVVLLVDPMLLHCTICETKSFTQTAHNVAVDSLRFIVLMGFDREKHHFFYRDPHVNSAICSTTQTSLDQARSAPGTNEDTLFFHSSDCPCVDSIEAKLACFLKMTAPLPLNSAPVLLLPTDFRNLEVSTSNVSTIAPLLPPDLPTVKFEVRDELDSETSTGNVPFDRRFDVRKVTPFVHSPQMSPIPSEVQ